jgi:UDPglucose 6-dehydrogenase
MVIAVIGTGFVGVVTAAAFAKFGHQVYGLDIDEAKIKKLEKAELPFFEPGLEELVKEGVISGRLKFTNSYATAMVDAEVIFISVGTPSAPDGQADTKYVLAAAQSLAPHVKSGAIVVIKSTVPPSTNSKVEAVIRQHTKKDFHVASVPEFLKEGTAVNDFLHPSRAVIGTTNSHVAKVLTELHQPLEADVVVVRPESAQMAKYAANAYLAQRITFINQMANLCEKNGADVQEVIEAMGFDERIGGHYWYPGLGYGGSCFPKDVKELAAYSRAIGEGDGLFVKIDELNEARIPKLIHKWDNQIKFAGKTVAVLGLSFKPNTSDTREAPARKVIPLLQSLGAIIRAYDPQVREGSKKSYLEVAKSADVLMLLVEWDEFKNLDFNKLKSVMKDKIFIDTRNQYEPEEVEKYGFKYIGIGR